MSVILDFPFFILPSLDTIQDLSNTDDHCFLLQNFSHAFPSVWNAPLSTVCLIRSTSLSNPKAQLLHHLLCEPTQLLIQTHFSLHSMNSTLFTPLLNQLMYTCLSFSELWTNCCVSLGSVWYIDAQCVCAEWIHPYTLWMCSISLHPVDDWTPFAFSHFCLVWRDDPNDSSWQFIWKTGIEFIGATIRCYWNCPRIIIMPKYFLYFF